MRGISAVRNIGGARNPYALAELIDGKKIPWDGMTSTKVRQKLEQTFRMPYENMFSPLYDSPLYGKKPRIGRRS